MASGSHRYRSTAVVKIYTQGDASLVGNCSTSPAESRYSPVEGECFSLADALHKVKQFVLCSPNLLIATDHKPLIGVFEKSLANIQNPRIPSITEKTLCFKFRVIHMESKLRNGPDYITGRVETTIAQLSEGSKTQCLHPLVWHPALLISWTAP